ncbi:hypothetical protein K474DRAFT_1709715 [Panus rudis PR-1116 ss-1]|nr:hypothetical protein K474DRAFT_1709715 [Panus rudis PR-1116 ss-1]
MSPLTDYVVGPMPFNVFVKKFMEPCNASVKFRKRVSKQMFHKIPLHQSSERMQEALARAINKNGLCPGLIFKTVSQADSRSYRDAIPPLGAFHDFEDEERPPVWYRLQFFAEVYRDDSHDPFLEFFRDSNRDYDIRGKEVDFDTKEMHQRLIRNLTRQFAHQHRTFTFVVVVFGRYARFLRVDRAGIVVSSAINYVANPSLLSRFLRRFSSLSPVERGFDPCAHLATPEEQALLTEGIHQYMRLVESGQARLLPESTGVNSFYVVQNSFTPERNFFGRGTRGFVAQKLHDHDISQSDPIALAKSLVFLKDSWYAADESGQSEGDVYLDLQEFDIAHIPNVFAAGSVYSSAAAYESDDPQSTTTDAWAYDPHRWRRTHSYPRLYIHYRVVQELLFPLSTVSHARELIRVMRDALQCVIDVFVKTRRLHRDISYSNIMISVREEGSIQGVLTDWDISRQISEGSTLKNRAGTWQFMSINLLMDPEHPHEFQDDLESILWVLLYTALHHFEHSGRFGLHIFDARYKDPYTGVESGALNTLIMNIRQFWGDYHHIDPEECKKRHASLQQDPLQLVALFDDALASPAEAWVHGEAVRQHDYTEKPPALSSGFQSSHSRSVDPVTKPKKRRRSSTSVSEYAKRHKIKV